MLMAQAPNQNNLEIVSFLKIVISFLLLDFLSIFKLMSPAISLD